MKAIYLALSTALLFISCNGKKSTNAQAAPTGTEEQSISTDTADDSQANDYIVLSVSDRSKERINKTREYGSPIEFRTAVMSNGPTITIDARLGSFEDEFYYGLELMSRGTSQESELEPGTYKLLAFGDGQSLPDNTARYFEMVNTLSEKTFENMKRAGIDEDDVETFYTPLNDANVFVIENAGEAVETENSTKYIREYFQPVTGYLSYTAINAFTGKEYKIRVDFNTTNEIRDMSKR